MLIIYSSICILLHYWYLYYTFILLLICKRKIVNMISMEIYSFCKFIHKQINTYLIILEKSKMYKVLYQLNKGYVFCT